MSEPENTNPVKTERPKNPKRVEQGKRLAEISREARKKKEQEQEEFFESAETEGNKIFFGIGLIAAVFLILTFLNPKKERTENEVERSEEDEVTEAYTEPEDVYFPAEPTEDEVHTKPRKTRSYEPYTMD